MCIYVDAVGLRDFQICGVHYFERSVRMSAICFGGSGWSWVRRKFDRACARASRELHESEGSLFRTSTTWGSLSTKYIHTSTGTISKIMRLHLIPIGAAGFMERHKRRVNY